MVAVIRSYFQLLALSFVLMASRVAVAARPKDAYAMEAMSLAEANASVDVNETARKTSSERWARCMRAAVTLQMEKHSYGGPLSWATPAAWEAHLAKALHFKGDGTSSWDQIIAALEKLKKAAQSLQDELQEIVEADTEDFDTTGPDAELIIDELIKPFDIKISIRNFDHFVGRYSYTGGMVHPAVIIGSAAHAAATEASMNSEMQGLFHTFRITHKSKVFTSPPVFTGWETPESLVNDILTAVHSVPWYWLEELMEGCAQQKSDYIAPLPIYLEKKDRDWIRMMQADPAYKAYKVDMAYAKGLLSDVPKSVTASYIVY
mmetsp:Transcript_62276/g.148646  ORF Transcript_62276/g.148646 Transcript_62276/m.148646 type:complete len:319 (-) Transcript_62276:128-1084(-)|eukprot:CAMPEP_0178459492 /NCGR_PEP_ID=MMETSP0689_2-20121128/48161_1 /TAXON_ID=160604 /ORGANISM="Amphidinium massartii, Strain CS-259" /LENGTH=318 /DNA_ID=CAMNT_0020085977 /DNA_START=33 /DNA_END=989 /DNA_ORIENTATION=-